MIRTSLIAVALATAVSAAGKRGLAWPWFNEGSSLTATAFGDGCGAVSHIYNWETWAPANAGNLNFIGTQRCMDCDSSPIGLLATRAQEQEWTDLFTLNEPDINGISPHDAAAWWKEHINPLEGLNRFTPAVTNSGNPNQGLDWLKQFFDSCGQECKHEGISIHWYAHNFDNFKEYLDRCHEMFPEEYVAISEFALDGNPSAAEQLAFFELAFPYLESLEWVDSYFPYVATSPSLMTQASGGSATTGNCLLNDDGSLSAIGSLMVELD